jgi:hypothetical protein
MEGHIPPHLMEGHIPPGMPGHVPPHLLPYVLDKKGRISKKKLARALLAEHGLSGYDLKGEGVKEIAKGIKTLVTKGVRGSLLSAPPSWVSFMKKYGEKEITGAYVCRKPIQSFVDKGLNLLTLGKWNKDKKELGYDNMFHLYLRLVLSGGPTVRIEKNQRVKASVDRGSLGKETEYIELVPQAGLTLNTLVQKGEDKQGKGFYQYDARDNNCQVFVMSIIEGNGLKAKQSGVSVSSFVRQKTKELLNGMIGRIGRAVTDLAGSAQVLVEGGATKYTYANYLKTL